MTSQMTPKEWLKYDWRVDVFLKKFKDKETFELTTGQKVIFDYDRIIESGIASRDRNSISDVRLKASDGNIYRMSSIGKTKDFGGRGVGSGTTKEDMELKSLREQLSNIKLEINNDSVPILIGVNIHNAFDVVTTPGTPKSDFHLIDTSTAEIAWISHKDGKLPRDFQQWGGISHRSEPEIFKHPEVQRFIADLKHAYPDGLPRATSLYRKIIDKKLKMISVYGNQYENSTGRQNVSLMIQGPVKLKKVEYAYEFVSNIIHLNGEDMIDGFEPVLTAIYKGDRSDAGVKGTRIVIMPIAGRKMSGEI
jgi:hypothetical protein